MMVHHHNHLYSIDDRNRKVVFFLHFNFMFKLDKTKFLNFIFFFGLWCLVNIIIFFDEKMILHHVKHTRTQFFFFLVLNFGFDRSFLSFFFVHLYRKFIFKEIFQSIQILWSFIEIVFCMYDAWIIMKLIIFFFIIIITVFDNEPQISRLDHWKQKSMIIFFLPSKKNIHRKFIIFFDNKYFLKICKKN